MDNLITSQARTNELIRFSSLDTDGFTPFITSRTSHITPTKTVDMVRSPERTEIAAPKVQVASRAPVVPRHTVPAMEELGVNMSRLRIPGISDVSLLLAPAIVAGTLFWTTVMVGPRITRWYSKRRRASRNLKLGKVNLLMGPGGERAR